MSENKVNQPSQTPASVPDNDKRQDAYAQWLQANYRALHDAVWEGHKTFWTTTSIFVPVVATAIGYLVTLQADGTTRPSTIVPHLLVIAVVWIWYGMFLLVRNYNIFRLKVLAKLEEALNAYYAPTEPFETFHCYSWDKDGKRQYGIGISLKRLFLIFPMLVTLAMLLLICATL